MLCQIGLPPTAAARFMRIWRCSLASLLWCATVTSGFAQNLTPQENLSLQVTQWVTQNLQLSEKQFSIAPLDSRLRVQGCDRALTMDLPFASRETVRVRCASEAPWQMYLRLVLATPAQSIAATPAASNGSTASGRKVVVGTQLLRRGTMVIADQLQEIEHSGIGLDPQAVASVRDLENGEMVRDIPAGTPLRSHDVKRAVLVKQGQSVLLTVALGNGLTITARVDALQDGKMGEQVKLKNSESGRLVTGIVSGPNAARSQ